MLPWIDALRGLAILMVLANHVALQIPGLSAPLHALSRFGQMGVQLFFIASAYTLCLSWQQRQQGQQAESRPLLSFLLRRFFRIAPLYWFAILLFAGLHLFSGDPHVGTGSAEEGSAWLPIAANLLFVHGWWPVAQNSVVPGGWSIGVEMVFYALFPLLLPCCSNAGRALGLAALVLGLNLLWQLPQGGPTNNSAAYFHPLNQLPVFLLGMAWFRWQHSAGARPLCADKTAVQLATGLALLLLALTALLWRSGWAATFALVPVSAGLAFVALAQACSQLTQFPPVLLAIGRASYAIYIIHSLFAWHGLQALMTWLPLNGNLAYALCLPMVTALSYVAARLLGRGIEAPGIAAGARLIRRLNQATLIAPLRGPGGPPPHPTTHPASQSDKAAALLCSPHRKV
jgi:peptidoglycan/LPS O-acetylase OafA/YrhL